MNIKTEGFSHAIKNTLEIRALKLPHEMHNTDHLYRIALNN